MKIKKTYFFALKSAGYVASFSGIGLFLVYFFTEHTLPGFAYLSVVAGLVFFITFFVVQFRLEKFIYQRIKKIYDNISLLDAGDLNKTHISADITSLSRDVEKFASDKQAQIQDLKMRENYRREFLGNISHELKTPLFTVQGYLLTLSDGAIEDKTIRTKYISRASKGVERLIAIVKDLDLISKLEAHDLNINKTSFDMVKLVQDVFDLLEFKAKKRNISLFFKTPYPYPIRVVGDEERIEQVLINLLVNSIKYGKVGGDTMVSIEESGNRKITIRIADNGEGIKKEHQARIFERFYRVDKSRSREEGGSGLGLAIAKHILEAHGESIVVKSTYKKGAEFSFTLEKSTIT